MRLKGWIGASASVWALSVFAAPGAAFAQVQTTSSSSSQLQIYTQVSDGRRNDTYQTQLVGSVDGVGAFDESIARAFQSADVQSALVQLTAPRGADRDGRAAVVIFSAPRLIDSQEEFLDSFTDISISTLPDRVEVTTQITYGDAPNAVIFAGDRGNCYDTASSGVTNVAPFDGHFPDGCDNSESTDIEPGTVNTNTHTLVVSETVETSFTNEDYLTTELYQIDGETILVGAAHAATRADLFDRGAAALVRLGAAPLSGVGARAERGLSFWMEGYGGRSDLRRDAEGFGHSGSVSGGAAGVRWAPSAHWSFGLAADHGRSDLEDESGLDEASITLTLAAATAALSTETWFASVSAFYGLGETDTVRRVPGVDPSRGDYGVSLGAVSGDVGYRIGDDDFFFAPSLGADWMRAENDAFVETGGLPLAVAAQDAERTRAWLGVTVGGALAGMQVRARVRAIELLSGERAEIAAAFVGAPTISLSLRGAAAAETSGDLTVEALYALTDFIDARAALNAASDGDSEYGFASLGVRMRW